MPDGLVWVFKKLLIYWDFHAKPSLGVYREWSGKEKISSEQQLRGRKCLVDVRGQRRMGRLVRDDRKATITQIITRYNQGMQNTISERTTRQTLKQMVYSSRTPHRVPLLSAKNRKRRLQFTQAHQYWTIISTNWALFKRHSLPEYCCCSYSVVRHNWNFKWDWLLWSDVTNWLFSNTHSRWVWWTQG